MTQEQNEDKKKPTWVPAKSLYKAAMQKVGREMETKSERASLGMGNSGPTKPMTLQ